MRQDCIYSCLLVGSGCVDTGIVIFVPRPICRQRYIIFSKTRSRLDCVKVQKSGSGRVRRKGELVSRWNSTLWAALPYGRPGSIPASGVSGWHDVEMELD